MSQKVKMSSVNNEFVNFVHKYVANQEKAYAIQARCPPEKRITILATNLYKNDIYIVSEDDDYFIFREKGEYEAIGKLDLEEYKHYLETLNCNYDNITFSDIKTIISCANDFITYFQYNESHLHQIINDEDNDYEYESYIYKGVEYRLIDNYVTRVDMKRVHLEYIGFVKGEFYED